MRFIRQEFKKIDPPLLLRQTSLTAKQQISAQQQQRLLHMIYILGKYAGMVGGEGFEPPTYSV